MEETDELVAIVTGGTVGVGGAITAELARRGWSVLCQVSPDCEPDEADLAIEEIYKASKQDRRQVRLSALAVDLTETTGREQLIEEVLDTFGKIDLLVNAEPPSLPASSDLLEMTESQLQDTIKATLTGPVFLTQLVANEMVRMVEAGQIENPRIVTINSIAAYTTSIDHGPHCLSRAALAMMTGLFADRLGEHGISVYEIRTGLISAGAGAAHARYDELIRQGLTPIRRWGRAGDIARAVAAVAEGLLGFSTGEVINVDGGFHLRRL